MNVGKLLIQIIGDDHMKIKDIFTQERISEVIEEMVKKGGESGPDGISVHDLSEYIERNSVVESLLDGSYKPSAPCCSYK